MANRLVKDRETVTVEPRAMALLVYHLSRCCPSATSAIGLSDEILNTLGRVDGLDVVARTSSHSIKATEDVREKGRKLNVQSVVEGAVRKAGNTMFS